METQKIPNSQSDLEKEKGSWRNQAPWLQTILYTKLQLSKQYGTGTKTNVGKWNRTASSEINAHTYGQLIYNKGGKTLNGEKTASSINGAGKMTAKCKKKKKNR